MKAIIINTVLSLLYFFPSAVTAEWQQQTAGIMGTNIRAEVFHTDPLLRQRGIDAVMAEMERINQLMSSYIDKSELSRINVNASVAPVNISKETFDLLKLARELSELSNGAFDITYASVGYLYDYRNKQRPDDDTINELLSAVDYRHVILDHEQQTVFFASDKVKIDLGGIAKGYAVDNAIRALEKLGIKHALVTAGGDTRLLGDRNGKPWIVGIRDPRDEDKQAVVLPLQNEAMSTSGDYERYFEEDGKRYHHILSPQTGRSSSQIQSVSIIGPQSVYNDALSTAVFVMGLETGIGLINSLPKFEAIVMDKHRRLHYSEGLMQ